MLHFIETLTLMFALAAMAAADNLDGEMAAKIILVMLAGSIFLSISFAARIRPLLKSIKI